MAETLVLKAQKRERTGTRVTRKLRTQGKIPAIIYGHQKTPVAVQFDAHDLSLELQHHHHLLEVSLKGRRQRCLVKDVQYDYLGESIIHVDLARVSLDERVQVTVSVELRGAPAGVSAGGVLDQLLSEVELECLVTNIPENIRVRIGDLQINQTLTAGEIELPEGVKLITEPDTPVAAVRVVAEEAEEEAQEAAAEAEAEPEVIQREKTEDEK